MTEHTTRRQARAGTSASIGDDALLCFFESTSEVVFVFDLHGTVVYVNAPFAELLNAERASLLQQPVDQLIDTRRNVEFARCFAAFAQTQSDTPSGAHVTVAVEAGNGIESSLALSVTPIDFSGQTLVVCTGRPLQPLTDNDRRAPVREQRLNEAQRIAQIGNWEWDILSNSDWWSDELYRILEVDPDTQKPSFEFFQTLIHPQDRERLKRETYETLETDKEFGVDLRVLLPSGAEKYIHSQGVVQRDPDGHPLKMTGTIQDVSERIRNTVDALDLGDCGAHRSIQVSIGITLVRSSDDFLSAFKRADKALYQAKCNGKNQIIIC